MAPYPITGPGKRRRGDASHVLSLSLVQPHHIIHVDSHSSCVITSRCLDKLRTPPAQILQAMAAIFARADVDVAHVRARARPPPPLPPPPAWCVSAHEFLGDTFISDDAEAAAPALPSSFLRRLHTLLSK